MSIYSENRSLSYPIGKCILPEKILNEHIEGWIYDIESLHKKLTDLCQNIEENNYSNKYRAGGWSIRQLLFHITDSHSHSYIRFKWTLTEGKPIIKAYEEKKWAQLPDSLTCDPKESLEEIAIAQRRLARVIKSLTDRDLTRSFIHPESNSETSLAQLIGHYAWHGNHHLEHIRIAINHPAPEYVPINCDHYDEFVLLAMHKTPLNIIKGENKLTGVFIKDIITSQKEEFLVLSDGNKIRLDKVKINSPGVLSIVQ